MTYTFDWVELASDSVFNRLHSSLSIGNPAGSISAELRATLASIFRSVGGLNLSDDALTAQARDLLALQLIDEACAHALRLIAPPEKTPGYVNRRRTAAESDVFDLQATASEVVSVNIATTSQIDGLPGLGQILARRIHETRQTTGWFVTSEDLDTRVRGLGSHLLKELSGAISYSSPIAAAVNNARDLDSRLQLMYSLSGSDPKSILPMLETLASVCGRDPHPYSRRRRRRRRGLAGSGSQPFPVDWVGVLANESYFVGMDSILAGAASSIEVCMFHIALGGPDHPSRAMLVNLVAAKERGVKVRVVVDRDRARDPYRSTVINTPAVRFLRDHKVSVRWDPEDRLLHSKFVVIDNALAVIGSHNWSMGSYAEYDDLSLVVSSQGLVDTLVQRFDSLWGVASAPSPSDRPAVPASTTSRPVRARVRKRQPESNGW